MIEMFLFVNPFGQTCLNKEKNILEWIGCCESKIQFRIIPFLNLRTLQYYLEKSELPTDDICLRNKLFQQMYSTALDFEAIQLQGKKKAREFLFKVQEAIGCDKKTYSAELVNQVIHSLQIDREMFEEDRRSVQVVETFRDNQNIAHEMGVVHVPSLVLFNYKSNNDFGVLLESHIDDQKVLSSLCEEQPQIIDCTKMNPSAHFPPLKLIQQ